jgi:hypothetical protein
MPRVERGADALAGDGRPPAVPSAVADPNRPVPRSGDQACAIQHNDGAARFARPRRFAQDRDLRQLYLNSGIAFTESLLAPARIA